MKIVRRIWQSLKSFPWSSLRLHHKNDPFALKWAPYSIILFWIGLSIMHFRLGNLPQSLLFGVGSVGLYWFYIFLRKKREQQHLNHEQFMQYLDALAQQQHAELANAPQPPMELQIFTEGPCHRCREPVTPNHPAVQCYYQKHLTHLNCLDVIVDEGVQCPTCQNRAAWSMQLTSHHGGGGWS